MGRVSEGDPGSLRRLLPAPARAPRRAARSAQEPGSSGRNGGAMIKVVAPALRNPGTRTLEEFHRYWRETHGPLFANTANLRRYVQHLTLPEAYDGVPKPTFDGVSMFWYDELQTEFAPAPDAETAELIRSVLGTNPEIS